MRPHCNFTAGSVVLPGRCFGASAFADIGEHHADDYYGHGEHLNPLQTVETHEDCGYGCEDRQKVLVNRYQFGPYPFERTAEEEVSRKTGAKHDETDFNPRECLC